MKFTTFDQVIENRTTDKINYYGEKLENICVKNYIYLRSKNDYEGKIYLPKSDFHLIIENFEKGLNEAGWKLCYEDCPLEGYEQHYDVWVEKLEDKQITQIESKDETISILKNMLSEMFDRNMEMMEIISKLFNTIDKLQKTVKQLIEQNQKLKEQK